MTAVSLRVLRVRRVTPRALQVVLDEPLRRIFWFPRSLVEPNHYRGGEWHVEIEVPAWLWEEKKVEGNEW